MLFRTFYCPRCQSLDVNFQELDRPIAYISAFLRVPIPVQRPAWHKRASPFAPSAPSSSHSASQAWQQIVGFLVPRESRSEDRNWLPGAE
jgi:hypothetical protein